MIEERRTNLDGMSHAHAVALHQDVVGQIILLIEPQKLRQSIPSLWQLVDFIQKTVKRGGKRLSKQRVLFVVGESPVPIYVSLFWLKQAAREESLQFVLDRKSTRLNSSHLVISYAVFC